VALNVIIRDIDIVTCPRKAEVPTPRKFIHAVPGGKGKKDGTFESPADSNNPEKIQDLLEEHPTYIYHGPKPVEILKKPVPIKGPTPLQEKKTPVVPPVPPIKEEKAPQSPVEQMTEGEKSKEEENLVILPNEKEKEPPLIVEQKVQEIKEEPVKKVKQRIRMWLSSPQFISNERSILSVEGPQSVYFHRHETALPPSQVAESIMLDLLNAFNKKDLPELDKQKIIEYINSNYQNITFDQVREKIVSGSFEQIVIENTHLQTPQQMKEVPNPQSHYVEKIPSIKPGKLITQAHMGEVKANQQGVNTAPKPLLRQPKEVETTPIQSYRPVIREKIDVKEETTDSQEKQSVRRSLNFNQEEKREDLPYQVEEVIIDNVRLKTPGQINVVENPQSNHIKQVPSKIAETHIQTNIRNKNQQDINLDLNFPLEQQEEISTTPIKSVEDQNPSTPQKNIIQDTQTPQQMKEVQNPPSHYVENIPSLKPGILITQAHIEEVKHKKQSINTALKPPLRQPKEVETTPLQPFRPVIQEIVEKNITTSHPPALESVVKVLDFNELEEDKVDNSVHNLTLSNNDEQVVPPNSSTREENGNLPDMSIDLTPPTIPIRVEKQDTSISSEDPIKEFDVEIENWVDPFALKSPENAYETPVNTKNVGQRRNIEPESSEQTSLDFQEIKKQEPVQVVFYEETPTKLQENTYSIILKKGNDLDYILNSLLELKEAENSGIVFNLNHLSEDVQEKVTHFVDNNKDVIKNKIYIYEIGRGRMV